MLTTDRNHPDLSYGTDKDPVPQAKAYLILSEVERAKGFVRPVRRSYIHKTCAGSTKMGLELCETYARDPKFYNATYCCHCERHLPVSEFNWEEDGEPVGS